MAVFSIYYRLMDDPSPASSHTNTELGVTLGMFSRDMRKIIIYEPHIQYNRTTKYFSVGKYYKLNLSNLFLTKI